MVLPPLVKTPRMLQLWQWTVQPTEYLENCEQKYGDCFTARLGKTDVVFFSHPQAIADIFNQSPSFDSGRVQKTLQYSMGTASTLVMDGERHRKRRQLMMPPFHGERMRNYGEIIRQITLKVGQTWQPGQTMTLLPQMNDLTLQVILEAVFGLSEGDRYEQLKTLLQEFLVIAASRIAFALTLAPSLLEDRGPLKPLKSFMEFRKRVDNLLYAEIADRRTHFDPDRTDILTLLVSARDEDGQPLSDSELRDELMTMLLAGHDSSAAILTWTLYQIHNHPSVKAKLLEELSTLGNDLDPNVISKLPYLGAVCNESMRLRPAGPTVAVRVTNEPVTIQGYTLPAETILLPTQYLTHHRADVYSEPRSFRPERFIEQQYSPYEFYPFGGGDRRCVGAAFAMFEMKLVLATILMNYQLELAEKEPVKIARRGVNISPQGGVKMILQKRTIQEAILTSV
jgi:cytochrome P450 family 110